MKNGSIGGRLHICIKVVNTVRPQGHNLVVMYDKTHSQFTFLSATKSPTLLSVEDLTGNKSTCRNVKNPSTIQITFNIVSCPV